MAKKMFYIKNKDFIHYSDAWFLLLTGQVNIRQFVCSSDHHFNKRPYSTTFDHLNVRLVRYLEPHCIYKKV